MTPTPDARVEATLRAAAADATWPPTPDIRAIVLARLEREGIRHVAGGSDVGLVPGRARGRALRLGRALAVAVITLLLIAGAATALGYRLPGLDILFVEHLPPAGTGLDLGAPTTIADAVAPGGPRVLVPSVLATPDTVFVLGSGDQRIVTLVWRATSGQGTLGDSDLALTVMAVPGDLDEGLVHKVIGSGTTLEPVSIGGSRGWWISGAPHDLVILRPDGTAGVLRSALAGDTLVFSRDGTLYRLESALGRDATIAVADSMR